MKVRETVGRSGRLWGGQGDCWEVRETVRSSGRLSESQGSGDIVRGWGLFQQAGMPK